MYKHPIGLLSRGGVLDVGLKCVHSCRFCYYSYLDRSDNQFKGMRHARFRTVEECKEILRLLKLQGFVNFDYTGGEPTLHPEIVEITRFAHQELGLSGRIITLGQFLMKRMPNCQNERLIDDLLDAGLVNFLFSTHAVDDELFRRITGGRWSLLESAMRHLDDRGFQYTSNSTVFQWNYQHLPAIARTLIRHNVYLHNFIIMNAYYQWNKGGRAFGVQARYSDIYPYLREAVELLEAGGVGVNIRYAPMCALRGLEKHLVGVVGVRYDPHEWMNQAGHFGGSPEFCAARLPLAQGEIDSVFAYREASLRLANGVEVIGARGNNVKHFPVVCGDCRARAVCDGVDPNYLALYGAEEFTPYGEGEWSYPVHRERVGYQVPFVVKTEQHEDMMTFSAASRANFREPPDRRQIALSPDCCQEEQGSCEQEVATVSTNGRDDRGVPRVSVIVPCYNYGRYLRDAVASVAAQTYQDFEIVIVNDGSTDDTLGVAKELQNTYAQHTCVVIDQENSGQPAISRNKGIGVARGEYIICLDADDMIAPTMLEECVLALDSNPGIAIAYTDRQDFGGVDQIVPAGDYDFARLRFANQISYCALFRRGVWDAVGGYRTNVKGCEDWDFWVAAGSRGLYGRRIPKPLFLYRRHDTGVYQAALKNFRRRAAQIVLNNVESYELKDMKAARRILEEVPESLPRTDLPLVSVIVPTYNRPDRLTISLASIARQTYPNLEIIVVNDGGVDVEELAKAQDSLGRVRYVRLDRNVERSATRNEGLRLAKGKYIAYLDDDDFFDPNHVETLVGSLENSGVDVAYSDAVRLWEVKEGDAYVVKKYDQPYSRDFDADALLVSNYIPILCLMHRRSCLEQIGLFDEDLSVYEDWEFFIRLSRAYRFKHVPVVTCAFTHRIDGSSTTSSHERCVEFPGVAERIHRRYAKHAAGKRSVLAAQGDFVRSLQQTYSRWATMRPPLASPRLTSIVILCRNQAEYTSRCVLSLVKHTPEPHEIIFVDNGSTDETPRMLEMLAAELPSVRIVRNRENLGFGAANNQGVALSRGETVVILNNDVVVSRGWLGDLLKALDSRGLGIVGPRSNYVAGPQMVTDVPYANYKDLDPFALQWKEAHRGQITELAKAVGFCMAIRREVIDKIGGFDPRFFPGNFEDDDFCIRARLAGFRVAMANEVFVHHFGSRTFNGENIDWSRSMSDNWARFKAKWGLRADLPLAGSFSIAKILSIPFDPEKHFVPLPEGDTALTRTTVSSAAIRTAEVEDGAGIDRREEKDRALFIEKWGDVLPRYGQPDAFAAGKADSRGSRLDRDVLPSRQPSEELVAKGR